MNDMVVHDGWEIKKLGELFGHRQERNFPTLPLLSVTGKKGVVSRGTLERRDTSNADKSKYLRVVPGDIAYNTMRMWQGVSGKSDKQGIVSPAYTVLQPKLGVCPDYAKYLFKLELLIQVFHRFSQGLVNDTLNLKYKNFAPIKVTLPPLPEQQKIAAILTSVDDVIEKTQAQINKLQDLKNGTMNELLTRGIGHTEFKESPAGMIPLDWEVKSIGALSLLVTKGATPTTGDPYIETGVTFYRSVNASEDGILKTKETKHISDKANNTLKRSMLMLGDVAISIVGAKTGKTFFAITEESQLPGNINQNIALIRPDPELLNTSLLTYILSSPYFQHQVDKELTTQAQPCLSLKQVGDFSITVPSYNEQIRIVEVLDSISNLILSRRLELESFTNLKKSLMQDLLTGKKRVVA